MLIDKQGAFWDGDAVSATGAGKDTVDLQAAGYLGAGEPMYFNVAAVNIKANATITVKLQEAAARTGSGLTSATDVSGATVTFTGASTDGKDDYKAVAIPMNEEVKRYAGAHVTVSSGGSVTLTAWLSYLKPEQWTVYDDAVTITTKG